MPLSSRPVTLVALAGLAVLGAALSWLLVGNAIAFDDPFIGLRYSRNMLDGHGLVFNPGAYVEGYTAFGWMMVAALGMSLGFEPLAFWHVLLTAAQMFTVWLTWRLGRQHGRDGWASLLAPALLVSHIATVVWPMLALESTTHTMLATAALLMMASEVQHTRRGSVLLGLVMFSICLMRFDGLIYVGILGVYELISQRSLRRLAPAIAVLAIGMLIYNGWRIAYYGDPLPNTFYAKSQEFSDKLYEGVRYLYHFARDGGPFAILAVTLPLSWSRATPTMKLCVFTITMHLAYVVVVGGDWMPNYRFVLTVLPALCLLMQESFWICRERFRSPMAAAALGAGILLAVNALTVLRSEYVQGRQESPYWNPVEARDIGEFLDRSLEPDDEVAVEWAGIIPFYLRQPVLDIFGLSDKEIIERDDFLKSKMGRGITVEYLVDERKPEVVVFCGRLFPTRQEAMVGVDCRIPHGGWIHGFYSGVRDRPEYEQCIARVGDGWWPFLIRTESPLRAKLCK